MFSGYADKENIPSGKPIVKSSEIDRVKRNLAAPLHSWSQTETNNNTKIRNVNSPITELAHTFTELAANETSCNNTPKRRLSLASSAGSPTPDILRIQSAFTSSSNSSADSSCTSDSGSVTKLIHESSTNGSATRVKFGSGSFKRYNSMPAGGVLHNEASPMLNLPVSKAQGHISPLAQQSSAQTSFYIGTDEASRDSQDSGIDRDEERFLYSQEGCRSEFVAPAIPPERTQAVNEHSPVEKKGSRHVVGSPDLFDCSAQDSSDSPLLVHQDSSDSPLLAHQLCSQSEEDDGFIDLEELEKQGAKNDVPDSIANMLTGNMLTGKTLTATQPVPSRPPSCATSFRGSLFRSPSMPQHLSSGYDIRRRAIVGSKRCEPPNDGTPTAVSKKRRGVISEGNMMPNGRPTSNLVICSANRLQRTQSMVENSVSFQQSKGETDGMTGDGRKCCLPLINGKNADLNSISHDTMARLVNNEYKDRLSDCTVIDCRYPYEYRGGHIKGAENIYTKEDIFNRYISQCKPRVPEQDDKRSILIFHCEFSSERAPKLSRFLRNMDRDINTDNYPHLYHPELYLLEGGYKVFYQYHKDLCDPDSYTPMLHKDHGDDLKTFRAKSKSWAGDEKRGGFRPGLSKRL